MPLKLLSHTEQVADYLRSELLRGRWSEFMPGALALKAELGTSHNTVDLALRQLEYEGLLVQQGVGKRRRIVLPENHAPFPLRIAILLYVPAGRKDHYQLDILHQLREVGHNAFFVKKTLTELDMDEKRVAKLVDKTEADAWVVVAGSRSVLEWFAAQPFPVFGLFGRMTRLPIAGARPHKSPALTSAVRRLVSLGHRRIVMLSREERRKPVPGVFEQIFLNELEAQGIPTSSYNLPDWEESSAGLRRLFDSLFQHTPPTALLIQTNPLAVAALQHFARQGIKVPQDVSLVCMDPDLVFAWCDPAISHIDFDTSLWAGYIVRWAGNVARGKEDKRTSSPLGKFIDSGSIGPVKG